MTVKKDDPPLHAFDDVDDDDDDDDVSVMQITSLTWQCSLT